MLGAKDFSTQLNIIVNEITENYSIDRNMLALGYKILYRKDDRNCLSLSDNFYYFSGTVKQLYNEINTYFSMIETFEDELCLQASRVCDDAQIEICNMLKQYYNVA